MFIVLHLPHNEGRVVALIDGPGFDTNSLLVDKYEVDASLRSFANEAEAHDFLIEEGVDVDMLIKVAGGYLLEED